MLTEEKKTTFRKLLSSMDRRKNKAFYVDFTIDGKVQGSYDMEQERTIDSKSPQDWLNSNFFFYDIENKQGEVGLKVRMK